DEALHPRRRSLQRIEKLQQEAAVEIHRARDVADGDDAGLARLAPAEAQIEQLARGGAPQCAAQIDARSRVRGLPAAARTRGQPAGDARRDAFDLFELVGSEGAEILFAERALIAGRADFLRSFAFAAASPRVERR